MLFRSRDEPVVGVHLVGMSEEELEKIGDSGLEQHPPLALAPAETARAGVENPLAEPQLPIAHGACPGVTHPARIMAPSACSASKRMRVSGYHE